MLGESCPYPAVATLEAMAGLRRGSATVTPEGLRIAGASGDSGMFAPYLAVLGAATTDTSGKALSDAVAGAMCWCPITSLGSELDPGNQLYQPGGSPVARTAPAPVRATFGADTFKALVKHPLTDKGLDAFVSDWAKTGQSIL